MVIVAIQAAAPSNCCTVYSKLKWYEDETALYILAQANTSVPSTVTIGHRSIAKNYAMDFVILPDY